MFMKKKASEQENPDTDDGRSSLNVNNSNKS